MLQGKLIKETVKCNIEQSWEAHYLIMLLSLNQLLIYLQELS